MVSGPVIRTRYLIDIEIRAKVIEFSRRWEKIPVERPDRKYVANRFGQGNDTGTQYRSGIYYTSDAQKAAAERGITAMSVDDLLASDEIDASDMPADHLDDPLVPAAWRNARAHFTIALRSSAKTAPVRA